eukprot:892845-Prorocentrum_minimum.AAC.1
MFCLIAPVTNTSDVQDSQKLGSMCFKRGLVPRTCSYWIRGEGVKLPLQELPGVVVPRPRPQWQIYRRSPPLPFSPLHRLPLHGRGGHKGVIRGSQGGHKGVRRNGGTATRGGDFSKRAGEFTERRGDFSKRAGEFTERGGDFTEKAGEFTERGGDFT